MDKQRHEAGYLRYEAYRKLLEISAEKLDIVRQGAFIDQAERFTCLGDEWDSLQREIESLEANINGLADSEEHSEQIRAIGQQIIHNQRLTEERLQQELGQLSGDLKSVRDHKTVLNAYYGMNRNEQIAYYFDEKK